MFYGPSKVTTVFEIDGARLTTLEGFYQEVAEVLIPGASWGQNLDAFNDILRGGFGTPAEGFTLIWKNAAISRERLGYPETVRQLEARLLRCHSTARDEVGRALARARSNAGPTVFDWIVEIIEDHGVDGAESEDNVALVLA